MTVILRKEVDCEGIFVNTEEFIVPSIRKYLPNYKEILEFFGGMPPYIKKRNKFNRKRNN